MEEQPQQDDDGLAIIDINAQEHNEQLGDETDEQAMDEQPEDVQPDDNQQDSDTQELDAEIILLHAEQDPYQVDQDLEQELNLESGEPLNGGDEAQQQLAEPNDPIENEHNKDCWLTLNGIAIFKALNDLDCEY